jgi:hypothetical protein
MLTQDPFTAVSEGDGGDDQDDEHHEGTPKEEEEDLMVMMMMILQVKRRKKYWGVLIDGKLLLYKYFTDTEPKKIVDAKNLSLKYEIEVSNPRDFGIIFVIISHQHLEYSI